MQMGRLLQITSAIGRFHASSLPRACEPATPSENTRQADKKTTVGRLLKHGKPKIKSTKETASKKAAGSEVVTK